MALTVHNLRFLLINFLLLALFISCFKQKSKNKNDDFYFYFVRHGETPWGKDDILNGPQDLSLNETGLNQATLAGITLKKILSRTNKIDNARIIASSLQRAIETAQKISDITNIPIIAQEQGLKERYYGNYRLVAKNSNNIPPDAEDISSFQERVVHSLLKILLTNYYHSPLIIVSHQKVFEYVSKFLTHDLARLPQGGIARFILKDGQWKLEIIEVEKLND